MLKYIQVADPNHKQLLDSAKMSHYNVKWSLSTLKTGLDEMVKNPEWKGGQSVFLEQGNSQAGFQFIIENHKSRFFLLAGCQSDAISDYIHTYMQFEGLNPNLILLPHISDGIFAVVYKVALAANRPDLYLHVSLDPYGRILYAFPSETEDFEGEL